MLENLRPTGGDLPERIRAARAVGPQLSRDGNMFAHGTGRGGGRLDGEASRGAGSGRVESHGWVFARGFFILAAFLAPAWKQSWLGVCARGLVNGQRWMCGPQ